VHLYALFSIVNNMNLFKLQSEYSPSGDQPKAISQLFQSFLDGEQFQVLLGVTGSGKTFTIANLLEKLNKRTLILTHNKTLAGQLYQEFCEFFPENAVEYFVSYYDYYQPEAYVVSSDTFIEKDSSINDEIDKLRVRATTSLLTRKDVIVVASVSCIYGLGSPKEFYDMMIRLSVGMEIDRQELLKKLISIQYKRNDMSLERGNFRVRGEVVDLYPAYEDCILRIRFFGDDIESLQKLELVSQKVIENCSELLIAPAKHFVSQEEGQVASFKILKMNLILD
jgi:excinuclease ABC subunit B